YERWQRPEFAPVDRDGVVVAVSDVSPVAAGDGCHVHVESSPVNYIETGGTRRRLNCRVTVDCDGRRVYGVEHMGYNSCAVAAGKPTTAVDPYGTAVEGDPKLDLDLVLGRVVVSDDAPPPSYSFTIELR